MGGYNLSLYYYIIWELIYCKHKIRKCKNPSRLLGFLYTIYIQKLYKLINI